MSFTKMRIIVRDKERVPRDIFELPLTKNGNLCGHAQYVIANAVQQGFTCDIIPLAE